MNTRKCQICRMEHPLNEYYTKNVYICKKCNTIIAYLGRFKKLINTKGINIAKDTITRDKLTLRAKENILYGHGINEVARCLILDLKVESNEI